MQVVYSRGVGWQTLEASQRRYIEKVTEDRSQAFLLVSEPLPTYTAGVSALPEELLNPAPCGEPATVAQVRRGGKWTYHGPGQVLVYPILHLSSRGFGSRGVQCFLDTLARGSCRFLQSLGLDPKIHSDPLGIYLPQGKIASFGIGVRRGVTHSGMALYLTPQQTMLSGIIACGNRHAVHTSLHEVGVCLDWMECASRLSCEIKSVFKDSKPGTLVFSTPTERNIHG